MKIVKIKGGLGNQLFQYAYAILLSELTKEEVKIDMSSYKDMITDPIRQPRLLRMNINLPIANQKDIDQLCLFKHEGNILSFKYRVNTWLESVFNKKYFLEKTRAFIDPNKIKAYQYFDGYWQSWRYIDAVWPHLKTDLVPNYRLHDSTLKMIDEVSKAESVFVGIRRGDYLQEKNHYGVFDNSYYSKAMNYISQHLKSPVFYVFSNDIPWVKNNIDFSDKNVVFREPEAIIDDFEDLLIMSNCKHSIIINSTYHWWGARLNDNSNKIVIAPQKWFYDNKPIDIVPSHWIRIEN
jgi:hypothetical protein